MNFKQIVKIVSLAVLAAGFGQAAQAMEKSQEELNKGLLEIEKYAYKCEKILQLLNPYTQDQLIQLLDDEIARRKKKKVLSRMSLQRLLSWPEDSPVLSVVANQVQDNPTLLASIPQYPWEPNNLVIIAPLIGYRK